MTDMEAATPAPTRRQRFEAELAEQEAIRDKAIAEIDALERFLAIDAGMGITAWRKARRAIVDGTAATDATLNAQTQAWAREDDTPAKATKRVGLIVERVDLESYNSALPDAIRQHPDVTSAMIAKSNAMPKGKA